MICDLVAKRPHRPDDARQRRGHGPLGPLRNGLWPKYGAERAGMEVCADAMAEMSMPVRTVPRPPARFALQAKKHDRIVADPPPIPRSSPAGAAR